MRRVLAFILLASLSAAAQGVVLQGVVLQGGSLGAFGNGVVGGPPTYNLSSRSTANLGLISAIFTSTTANATSCAGQCQNSTAYDTAVNASGIDCYSRLTDGTAINLGKSAIGTASGGDNDRMWSANEDFLGVADTGGFVNVYAVAPDANGCLKVTGPAGVAPIRVVAGPFAFDPNVDNVFYVGSGTTIQKYTIANINTLPTPTTFFDFAAAGNCPGIPAAAFGGLHGIMIPSPNATRFGFEVQSGPQNTAIWNVFYDTTLGCSTVNWQTGQVWGWCLSSCSTSTTPLGTMPTTGDSCWGANPNGTGGGIHDAMLSTDGSYYFITINGTWTQGVCAGNSNNNQFIAYQVGTLNNSWGDGDSTLTHGKLVSHSSPAQTLVFSPQFDGANSRPLSNLAAGFNVFGITRNTQDIHQGPSYNCGLGADLCPWVGATNSVVHSAASGCSNATQCPAWPNNLVVAQIVSARSPNFSPWILFGHTFACGPTGVTFEQCPDGISDYFGPSNAIGSVSPKGDYFCFASSMLHNLGTDNNGNPRADEFCIHLQ